MTKGITQDQIKTNVSDYTERELRDEAQRIIETALREDLNGEEDITSAAIIPSDRRVVANLIVKRHGVLAGLPFLSQVFLHVDPEIKFTTLHPEGAFVTTVPSIVARIEGRATSILVAERTALNLVQRLSGIATMTHELCEIAAPYGITILDTRKTTPGLRALEKYAVRLGGGSNHRRGLYDQILIKDNHIAIAGGITEAVRRAHEKYPGRPVEIETTNFLQVGEAVSAGVETIMLDNMSPQQIKKAIAAIDKKCVIEVSGGISQDNLPDYLIPGVDRISIGALTHSTKSLDISLDIEV